MLALRKIRLFFATFSRDKNYYQILGVKSSSTPDQIKKAYRELAKKYHPDVNKGNQETFKNINEAYEVLSNQSSRNEYDSTRISQTTFGGDRTTSYPKQSHNSYESNDSNRWGPLTPQEREILQMMRRHQEQYMRQYQRQFWNSQQNRGHYRSQQEEMEDQYIRKYYENANKRQRHREYSKQRRNQQQRDYYNERFDRSKDSIFTGVGDAIKALWQMWKDKKNKK